MYGEHQHYSCRRSARVGKGGRAVGEDRVESNLTTLSTASLVYVFLIERIFRSVMLEMAGKEFHSSLVNNIGHCAAKSGVMEVGGEVGDP